MAKGKGMETGAKEGKGPRMREMGGGRFPGGAILALGDAMGCYGEWEAPTCIISDGPYGLGKFPGEPRTPQEIPGWYAPHARAWAKAARTDSTLWFWCTEVGWALTHPVLEASGWQYEECCVWDKGIAHVAGNCNSKTIRGMPVVSEVAARYTRRNTLAAADGRQLGLKEWVREEWLRSGLPLGKANEACGVRNAATRKYLTQCHLWYFPPAEALAALADYCQRHGRETGRPYFSLDGVSPFDQEAWAGMRSKWRHTHGTTNVWRVPPVHGAERVKGDDGYAHANQKPLSLMELQIASCTDKGDVVWEPFAGLASASVAAIRLERRPFAAEMNEEYFKAARSRLLGG